MKQRIWKAFDVALIVTALAIAAWAIRGYVIQKNADLPADAGTISEARISIDAGDGSPLAGNIAASGAVLDVTRSFAEKNGLALETKTYPGMGTLVTRIGESKNGAGGAYWQYWVNGNYATVSADNATVRPGDQIEWKFSNSEQQ